MSRDPGRDDRPDWDPAPPSAAPLPPVENFVRDSSAKAAQHRPAHQPGAEPRLASRLDRTRHTVVVQARRYRTSAAEQVLLTTVGSFRAVAADDLIKFQYLGNRRQFEQDTRHLKSQGLIRTHRIMVGTEEEILEVVVLTREAKALLTAVDRSDGQQMSHVGLVKPREIAHDAALYRMYEAEAAWVRNRGGSVRRVILDYELKANIYASLAKARSLVGADGAKVQKEIAEANGLPIVAGRILLPDLRLEYETAEGDLAKVDLELATHHYHLAYALEKARVGFRMYADGPVAARLNARLTRGRASVPDGPGLTDAILSL